MHVACRTALAAHPHLDGLTLSLMLNIHMQDPVNVLASASTAEGHISLGSHYGSERTHVSIQFHPQQLRREKQDECIPVVKIGEVLGHSLTLALGVGKDNDTLLAFLKICALQLSLQCDGLLIILDHVHHLRSARTTLSQSAS